MSIYRLYVCSIVQDLCRCLVYFVLFRVWFCKNISLNALVIFHDSHFHLHRGFRVNGVRFMFFQPVDMRVTLERLSLEKAQFTCDNATVQTFSKKDNVSADLLIINSFALRNTSFSFQTHEYPFSSISWVSYGVDCGQVDKVLHSWMFCYFVECLMTFPPSSFVFVVSPCCCLFSCWCWLYSPSCTIILTTCSRDSIIRIIRLGSISWFDSWWSISMIIWTSPFL